MQRALVITVFVQCLLAPRAFAVTLPFERRYVEPFYAPELQVIWAATNTLPAKLRVFKVVPASFTQAALMNLTAMGGSADAKRGWMNLYLPTDAGLTLDKVPDQARAYELGTSLLAKLGIPADDLLSKGGKPIAWYYPGTRGRMNRATRKFITEPCTMGIEFRRLLDGFECFGQYVHIQYESQEAVRQLEVRWHGVQPHKSCVVASPNQIVSWIKEGRARAHPVETTGSRWIKVADIKKVVIRNVRVLYDAASEWESTQKSPAYLYPYAGIVAEIEFSADDRETIGLSCPIISEASCRAIRKSSEFNILPKDFEKSEPQKEGSE